MIKQFGDFGLDLGIRNPMSTVAPEKAIRIRMDERGGGVIYGHMTLHDVMELSNQLRRYATIMAAGVDPESNNGP